MLLIIYIILSCSAAVMMLVSAFSLNKSYIVSKRTGIPAIVLLSASIVAALAALYQIYAQ